MVSGAKSRHGGGGGGVVATARWHRAGGVLFEAPSPLARGSRGDWFTGRYSSGLVSGDHYADVWAHGCFSSRVGKPVCKNDFIESLIKMSLITTGRYSDGEVKDLVAPG